jgi:hypothetical protein
MPIPVTLYHAYDGGYDHSAAQQDKDNGQPEVGVMFNFFGCDRDACQGKKEYHQHEYNYDDTHSFRVIPGDN